MHTFAKDGHPADDMGLAKLKRATLVRVQPTRGENIDGYIAVAYDAVRKRIHHMDQQDRRLIGRALGFDSLRALILPGLLGLSEQERDAIRNREYTCRADLEALLRAPSRIEPHSA